MNSPCAKVLAAGQNACTAQKRRGPEGPLGGSPATVLPIRTIDSNGPLRKERTSDGKSFLFGFRRPPAGFHPIPTAPVRRRRTGAVLLCNLFPHFRKEKKSGLRFAIFRQLSRKPNSLSGFALWKTLWKLWITPGMQSYRRSYGNHFTACVPRIFRSFTRVLHRKILRPSPALYRAYRKAARPRKELPPSAAAPLSLITA